MRIAVVGGGIAGLTSAYYLSKHHEVSLFEANSYLGGHTDTHEIPVAGEIYNIDTGFIVFNQKNYPNFTALLEELDVVSQPTSMSFSVSNTASGLEYNATDLNRLFCQRRNLVSPRFYRMLWDLLRFYRQAPALLNSEDDGLTLADYLQKNGYSRIFIEDHLIPMACALWSGPASSIAEFPARYFVSFMHNHNMLKLKERPQWRVVEHGSKRYIDKLTQRCNARFHTNAPVQQISRDAAGVSVRINGENQRFDRVVIATHADQALSLIETPSQIESDVLGNIRFQENTMLLHSDSQVLPRNRAAWASWNVRVGHELQNQCTVSYHMNTLQSLSAPLDFIVSLNSEHLVDPKKVFVSRRYHHPVYNHATLTAQKRWSEIAGFQHTYHCGAYWGWGFHEDGVKSALKVVETLLQAQDVSNVA